MSTPDQAGPGRPARLAGLALLAIAAIALVVGVISLVSGGDDQGASPPPSSESQQPPPTEQSPAPPPPTSAQPPTSAPPSPPTSAPPATQPPPPPPSPTGPDRSQPVRVYNNSNIKGLADAAATDLRGVGWQVTEVGNYPGGVIATTTVYYRPGTPEEAAAKEMAKEFAIRSEARFQGIQDSPPGIIVIVTREYNPRSK